MPAFSETLVALERRLVERLRAFDRLDEAWPRGRSALDRAETLADAAVQVRWLMVMADEEPQPHALLAPPDAHRLVASVLAVIEREAGCAAAQKRNIL